MRKGLLFLAPFALVAGLHMACDSTETRSGFTETPRADDDGGGVPTFETIDASTDARGCAESTTEILRIPVVIEFAVDESGSMDGSGANDKWGAARDALLAAFEDMRNTADPGMFVGLLRWSTDVGDEVDPGPIADQSHYDDLVDTINTPKAGGGGTSMLKGLTAAYKAVGAFTPPAGFVADEMHRAVVLVSDGAPATSEKPLCEDLAEEKLNEQPPKGPILTFSVGIGPFPTTSTGTYDPAFMSRIAQKGGTAPPGCSPSSLYPADVCHFQITPAGADNTAAKQALVDAISQIRALSVSCEFTFTRNENTNLGDVRVEITDQDGNKTEIPKDDENGWSFDDPDNPTKIVLHGEACTSSSGTLSSRVDVVLGCKGAN
ncbi:MAG: hypothetical protein K0S65_2251 [Labilithrix sp.]|nr:hypothetical protein [Labilithrix sp.]